MPDRADVVAGGEALVSEIRAGDTTAFARWLAGAEPRLRDSLRGFATRIDIEAVLQEALLRVWQVRRASYPTAGRRRCSASRFASRGTSRWTR